VFGEIGVLENVLDLPQQALFQILHHDKEVLIPVVEEVIMQVDRARRTIYIRAPEGLIDLYL